MITNGCDAGERRLVNGRQGGGGAGGEGIGLSNENMYRVGKQQDNKFDKFQRCAHVGWPRLAVNLMVMQHN